MFKSSNNIYKSYTHPPPNILYLVPIFVIVENKVVVVMLLKAIRQNGKNMVTNLKMNYLKVCVHPPRPRQPQLHPEGWECPHQGPEDEAAGPGGPPGALSAGAPEALPQRSRGWILYTIYIYRYIYSCRSPTLYVCCFHAVLVGVCGRCGPST